MSNKGPFGAAVTIGGLEVPELTESFDSVGLVYVVQTNAEARKSGKRGPLDRAPITKTRQLFTDTGNLPERSRTSAHFECLGTTSQQRLFKLGATTGLWDAF